VVVTNSARPESLWFCVVCLVTHDYRNGYSLDIKTQDDSKAFAVRGHNQMPLVFFFSLVA
jgi:hypothetical protein